MSLRRTAFALLLLFAFLTPFIAPAYIAAGLLLVGVDGLAASRERRRPESLRSPIVFVLLVLALLTIASAVFSRDPAASARHLPGLSLFLLVPIAMDLVRHDGPGAGGRSCRSPPRRRCSALYGIWQFLHGGNDLQSRIRATLSHYMTFSGLAALLGLPAARVRARGAGPLAGARAFSACCRLPRSC